MRSRWAILVGVGLTACGWWAGGEVRLETRTFELNYLGAGRAEQVLLPYVYLDRKDAPGRIQVAGNLVTVRETPDNLERIAQVLAEYDRPRPPVQLRFQIILADGSAARDPAIAEVEAALRKLFRFQGYRLAAEAIVGGLEGSHITQIVNGEGGPYTIMAWINELRGSGDSVTVRLGVSFRIGPTGASLETAVSARAGQTVVLGNAGAPASRGTVILTVRPDLARD